jgi:archaellum biogenesis ATPase FlaH
MKITRFPNVLAQSKTELDLSWSELVHVIEYPEAHETKQTCPLIKLGAFGDIRTAKNSLRHDPNVLLCSGLEADYDGEKLSPETARDILTMWGITAAIYTSPSHTEDKPRWRILAPLAVPCSPSMRWQWLGKLNGIFGGILAPESFTLSQTYYYGRVNCSHIYKSYSVAGVEIDKLNIVVEPIYPIIHTDKNYKNEEFVTLTSEQIEDLRAALIHVSSEVYNDRISVGQALIRCGEAGKQLWLEWLDNAGRTFKHPTHDKWETLTGDNTGYEAIFSRAKAAGWVNPRSIHPVIDVSKIKWDSEIPLPSIEDPFKKYSCHDDYDEIGKKLVNNVFVLGRLIPRGTTTVIYAKPNTGKTLISLKLIHEALLSARIDGSDVIFINADDTLRGAHTKIGIFRNTGVKVLIPGQRSFKTDQLGPLMRYAADTGTAKNKILLVDTAKKFVDLMDKLKTSQWMNLCREFTSAGGTVILLAHVNKKRGDDGKIVSAGTSDMTDDADFAYLLDEIVTSNALVKTVNFENTKARGDGDRSCSYSYSTVAGISYEELFNSVREISENEIISAKVDERYTETLDEDLELIDAITDAISKSISKVPDISAYVTERALFNKAKVRSTLTKYRGDSYRAGAKWGFNSTPQGQEYYLLEKTS